MIDVVNKTCSAGVVEEFKFQDTSIAFRVKNFSDGLIRVCLGKAWDDAQAVTVGSGIAETVISNTSPQTGFTREATSTVLIKASSSGTIEVIRND